MNVAYEEFQKVSRIIETRCNELKRDLGETAYKLSLRQHHLKECNQAICEFCELARIEEEFYEKLNVIRTKVKSGG